MKGVFVTGIGTDVGKTVVAAILTEALGADYWKPVQAGNLGFTDSDVVRSLLSNQASFIHPEVYRLHEPMSPHAAAKIDGVEISLDAFVLPHSERPIVVEGAGGLMVPLNDRDVVADLIAKLALPVVVVSRNYLGSINHSLLTLDALAARGVKLAGVIFNGEENAESERIILQRSGAHLLGRVGVEEMIDQGTVKRYAHAFREILS